MIYKASACLAVFCLLASTFVHADAQTPGAPRPPSIARVTNEKRPRSKPHDSAAQEQPPFAFTFIKSLADEADTYKDQALRVRVQARAADALWDSDSLWAHHYFLRAWEAADKHDRDSQRATDEARRSFLASRKGLAFIPPATNLRSEVLSLVIRRDRRLGEELLDEMGSSKEPESVGADATPGTQPIFFDPTEPDLVTARRLELATELVAAGQVEQAKRLADPGLFRVTSQGIIFLGTLRQRDARAADQLYSNLLERTANDPTSDATEVSLLSSYVFTPNLIVTATRRGRLINEWGDAAPTANQPEGLRPAFFRVAADVLLRPVPPQDQDRTSAGRAGTYFTIARLLPLFERYSPDQLPALNARLAFLNPDTPSVYKNDDNGMLTVGLVPENPNADTLSGILRQISAAAGVAERDQLYVKAIRVAANKGDARVREFADRIDDPNLRKWARAFADFVVVRKALDGKDVETALTIIRDGTLTPIQRVWAYTQAASLLKRSDPSRSTELLGEAASVAFRIDNGELDRVYALSCVSSHFHALDPVRAWEVADEVVKASNAVPESSADDGRLTARLQGRGVVAMEQVDVTAFNLTNLFELLAKENPTRATDLARGLKGEAPRATAHLAVARVLLRR